MATYEAIEIVRIRPKDGAIPRLRAIRAAMVGEHVERYGDRVRAELFECEDGTWVDVWRWSTRALAEEALGGEPLPAFAEWLSLVEPVAFDWATPAG